MEPNFFVGGGAKHTNHFKPLVSIRGRGERRVAVISVRSGVLFLGCLRAGDLAFVYSSLKEVTLCDNSLYF